MNEADVIVQKANCTTKETMATIKGRSKCLNTQIYLVHIVDIGMILERM